MKLFSKYPTKTLLFLSTFIASFQVFSDLSADTMVPSDLLLLDERFSHHVLLAEKATHTLHLFTNDKGTAKLVKSYPAATGKLRGNKWQQGDFKTPEGVYTFTHFIPSQELLVRYGKEGEIYGAGAFVMDYPNPLDRIQGKGGGGIWLHSTNDNSRINKGLDSRGCVVVTDLNLKDVSHYIELTHTPILVTNEIYYIPESRRTVLKDEIMNTLHDWLNAWKTENFATYISHYSKNFKDHSRGGISSFAQYKKAVFQNPGVPQIDANYFSIIKSGENGLLVRFEQHYVSKTIKDTGRKTLYLERDDNYAWKIVSESFTPYNREEIVAFSPGPRYFRE